MNWWKVTRITSIFAISIILLVHISVPVGAQLIDDGGGGTALKCGRSYEVRNIVTYTSGLGFSITTTDMIQYISASQANALIFAYSEEIRHAGFFTAVSAAGVYGTLSLLSIPSGAATTIVGLVGAFYVYQLQGEINNLTYYNGLGSCGLKIEQKFTFTFNSSGTTIRMVRNVISQQSTTN